MGLIEKLEALAVILDKKAELHDAIAVDHEMNKETQQGQHRRRRAASARSYAGVSREAAKALSERQRVAAKRAAFVPPHLAEVEAYALEKFPKWPTQDVNTWWNHFESVGWKVNTKPMVDWRAAAANGYRRWEKENPQASPTGAARDVDPAGWREWLAEQKREYMPYRFAIPPFLKEDFRKSKSNL